MRGAAAGDHRLDAQSPHEATVLVVVVATVAEHHVGPPMRPPDQARNGRDLGEEGQQLRDVVTVAAGQRHRERDALTVDEDVVLAARTRTVDRAGSAFGPRRAARTWLESITARDQWSCFAARNFCSRTT